MWKVRETKRIGVKTFWEVYKVFPDNTTVFRGRWKYKAEAEALADKLNREEAKRERIQ